MVVCTAEGANGDSETLLWRFRGYPPRPPVLVRICHPTLVVCYRRDARISLSADSALLCILQKKDTNVLQRYGVTVQIRLYHSSKNNSISIYINIFIYIDIEVFYTPLTTIFGTVTP